MRGRDVFLDSLRAQGVSRIFGNPGTTESPLLDNLHAYPELSYTVALHEGVALCAASFYAQASGRAGVGGPAIARVASRRATRARGASEPSRDARDMK